MLVPSLFAAEIVYEDMPSELAQHVAQPHSRFNARRIERQHLPEKALGARELGSIRLDVQRRAAALEVLNSGLDFRRCEFLAQVRAV